MRIEVFDDNEYSISEDEDSEEIIEPTQQDKNDSRKNKFKIIRTPKPIKKV